MNRPNSHREASVSAPADLGFPQAVPQYGRDKTADISPAAATIVPLSVDQAVSATDAVSAAPHHSLHPTADMLRDDAVWPLGQVDPYNALRAGIRRPDPTDRTAYRLREWGIWISLTLMGVALAATAIDAFLDNTF